MSPTLRRTLATPLFPFEHNARARGFVAEA